MFKGLKLPSLGLFLIALGSQAAERAEAEEAAPMAPVTPVNNVNPGLSVDRFADTSRAFASQSHEIVFSVADLQRIKVQLATEYANQNSSVSNKAPHFDLGFSNARVVEKKSQSGQWVPHLDLGEGFSSGPAVDIKAPPSALANPSANAGSMPNPPLQEDAKGTPLREQDMGYQEVPLPDDVKLQLIEASFQLAASRGQSINSRDKVKEIAASKRMHLQMINVGGKMLPILIFDPANPDGKAAGALPDGALSGNASGGDPEQRFNLSSQDTLEILKIVGEKNSAAKPESTLPAAHTSPPADAPLGHGAAEL